MTDNTQEATTLVLDRDTVLKTAGKRSFCTLATVSAANRPHAAAVIYSLVDTTLYVNTGRNSRKARNIADNPNVGIVIPVRRVPLGAPPSTLQFQAKAEILPLDDPDLGELHKAGLLKTITRHGEMDDPANCFLRITPNGRIHTYGLGMSLWQLARHPLDAFGHADLSSR